MSSSWWRRHGVEFGHLVGPYQQHLAGSVVHHEAGCGAEAARSQPGAVAVAGGHQQVGAGGLLHHLALDPPGAEHPPRRAAEPAGGGLQQLGGGGLGEGGDPPARVAARAAATEQSEVPSTSQISTFMPSLLGEGDGPTTRAAPGRAPRPDQGPSQRRATQRASVAHSRAAGTVSAPSRRNSPTGGSASRARSARRHSSVASEPT